MPFQLDPEREEFRLLLPPNLLDRAAVTEPLVRKMIFGHLCSHCGMLLQTCVDGDKSLETQAVEHFQFTGNQDLPSFGDIVGPMTAHSVMPQFRFTQAGPGHVWLMEKYHWGFHKGTYEGCCPYRAAVFQPHYDPRHYLLLMLNLVVKITGVTYNNRLDTLLERLSRPDGAELAEKIVGLYQEKFQRAKDVTGRTADVFQLRRSDWSWWLDRDKFIEAIGEI